MVKVDDGVPCVYYKGAQDVYYQFYNLESKSYYCLNPDLLTYNR